MARVWRLRRPQQDADKLPGHLKVWLPYFLAGLERGRYAIAWTWPTRADHPPIPAKRPRKTPPSP